MNANLKPFLKATKLKKKDNVTKNLGENMTIDLITRMLNALVNIAEQAYVLTFATTMLKPDDIKGINAYIIYKSGDVDFIFYDYDYYDYETGEQFDDVERPNTIHTNINDPDLSFYTSENYVIVYEDDDNKFKFLTKDMM
jgi:hypothetical protein